eukprot:CFRG8294T1
MNLPGGVVIGHTEMNYGTHTPVHMFDHPHSVPVYPIYPAHPNCAVMYNPSFMHGPPMQWMPSSNPQAVHNHQIRQYSAATALTESGDHYQALQDHLSVHYKVGPTILNTMIDTASSKDDVEKILLALEDYRGRNVHLTQETIKKFVAKCHQLADKDAGLDTLTQVLTQTQKYRVFPDRPTLRTVLSTLRKSGRIDAMVQVFEEHRGNYKGHILILLSPLCKAAAHDVIMFNTVYKVFEECVITNHSAGKVQMQAITALSAAALKFGKNTVALDILDQVKVVGLDENQSSFGIRLHALTNLDRVTEAIEELEKAPQFCKYKLPEFTVRHLQEKVMERNESSELESLEKVRVALGAKGLEFPEEKPQSTDNAIEAEGEKPQET